MMLTTPKMTKIPTNWYRVLLRRLKSAKSSSVYLVLGNYEKGFHDIKKVGVSHCDYRA
jgi:hypothetical protein